MAKFDLTLEMEDADIELIPEVGFCREPHDEKDEDYVTRFVSNTVSERLMAAKRQKQAREVPKVVLTVSKAVAK